MSDSFIEEWEANDCATCAFINRRPCLSCIHQIATKQTLLRRMLDDHFTDEDRMKIKRVLLKEYDFDYAIRYEGKTPRQLLQQTIDDARKQMPVYQQIMFDHLAKEFEEEGDK